MAIFNFKAAFETTKKVTVEEEFIGLTIQEADAYARQLSNREGLVRGKYIVYTLLGGNWVDIDVIRMITREVDTSEPDTL